MVNEGRKENGKRREGRRGGEGRRVESQL